MAEIRIEPALSDEDVERSLVVYNAVHPRDPVGLTEARDWERQMRSSAAYLAELDGTLAGAAHVGVPSYTDTPEASVYVLPDRRRLGVGHALYETVSRWAAENSATEFRASVDEDDSQSLEWAERRGFVEHARDVMVELELAAAEPPPPDLPPDVEITTWAERPDLARGMWEVACEAWPDIPGHADDQVEPFEEWLDLHMSGAGDRPEGVFLAVAGGQVVGYAKLSFWDALPDTLMHDLTGVRRSWRGRGIARALKRAQVAWAKSAGYARLRTFNEQRNEPIRRLNEELGYRPIPGRIRLRGPIAAP